jgi:predicted ATP-dependent endonuclease of OLD family
MMRAGRAAAFFARAIIIVEGLSEEIALPAFARHMGYNLDRDGISVINADGNAFAYILKACNEDNFAVPCVVTFDTDALEDGNTLVAQAYKARLIDQSTCHDYKDTTAKERQKLLSGLGWIPAQSNFEEECGNSGFLGIIRKAIDEEGATKRMEGYMTEKSLTNDLHGIAAFLKNSRRGESLKIPIAYKIANEVGSIGHVPSCYAEAINLARKFAKVAK